MVGYDEGQRQLTTTQYALAGATSGIITRLLLQPVDVIKIRLQIQVQPAIKQTNSAPSSKYRGLFQSLNVVARQEGIKALWKGHVPAQLLSISYGCVQFASFEALTKLAWKVIPHEKYANLKPVTHFVCGGLSGCLSSLVVQPMDVLRTRLVAQGEPKVYDGLYQAITAMYHENGLRTFYKGLLPTLLEVFPQAGMHFAFYTGLQLIWKEYMNSLVDSEVSESLFCGAMSGILSKIIIHPLDVVKKRLQYTLDFGDDEHYATQRALMAPRQNSVVMLRVIDGFAFREGNLPQSHVHTTQSTGMLSCIKTMVKNEGIRGFYKGLKVNIIKGASSVGVSFLAYEQCCKYMKNS